MQNVMLSNEDQESPLAKVASIIGDVFDVVNSEKKDELFDAGNPTETITTRISRTDVWDALSEFAIPHIHYSCEEIFAGKVGLLNIDFISGQGQTSSLKTVRSVIASWYKILRLIATVLFLSVLIYTGIKIMISSTAKDKAKYKEWIINWIVGFAILYFLHYLMSFIIVVISKFNTMLSNSMQYVNVSVKGNVSSFSFNTNLIGLVRFCIQSDNLLFRTGYLILYTMLTVYTFKFTMIYLKRLINMAFLTLIAPIVAFTYPIDKMADGQAQGFDMWVKEYIFNALLQPMHFLLYYVLVGSAVRISGTNPLYAIAVLAFMPEGERLLKKIFGFDKAGGGTVKGMQDAIAGAAIASSLKGMLGKGPKGGPDASKMQSPGALIKDFKDDKLSAAGAALGAAGAAGATAGAAAAQAHEDEHDHDEPPPPPPPPPQQQQQQQSQQHQSQQQNNGDDSNLPPPPQFNGNMEPIKQKEKTPIHKLANKVKNSKIAKSKVGRGLAAIGKNAVRPIYDFDKSGKYNGKRFIRNVAKGAVGTAVGLTATAVQAGISLTDGKYSPAEAIGSFAAGYGFAGNAAGGAVDTFTSGYRDGYTKPEKMKAFQEDFSNRDDVIQFCKENYGDDWREQRDRMVNNFVPRGFTDLSEMKEMMKYSNNATAELTKNNSNLTEKQKIEIRNKQDLTAMAIKNVQKRKAKEGTSGTPYNEKKERQLIAARTKGMSQAQAETTANTIRNEDEAIRRYNQYLEK